MKLAQTVFGIVPFFFLIPMGSAQTTWYVDVGAAGPGSGTSIDPYASIQHAIDQAATVSGDTLEVLPGVYLEVLDYSGKSLVIRSQAGAATTTLEGSEQGTLVQVRSGEGSGTRLEGFTLLDGKPVPTNQTQTGGILVLNSELAIVDCILDSCGVQGGLAMYGGIYAEGSTLDMQNCSILRSLGHEVGGVYLLGCTATFTDCLIRDNECYSNSSYSPGIYGRDSQVTMTGCEVNNNSGVYVEAALQLRNCDADLTSCTFRFNTNLGFSASIRARDGALTLSDCSFQRGWSYGAGHLFLWDVASTIIDTEFREGEGDTTWKGGGAYQWGGTSQFIGCSFLENRAGASGAFALNGGTASFENCMFRGNIAYYDPALDVASALLVEGGGHVTAEQCRFVENHAQTLASGSAGSTIIGSVDLVDCTIIDNLNNAGTAAVQGATLDHCIVWNNETPALGVGCVSSWSDIQGGWPGLGNIDQDPLLDLNQMPLAGSPCIDSGDPLSSIDADGSPREIGAMAYAWPELGTQYCTAFPSSNGLQAQTKAYGEIAVGNGPLYLVTGDLPMNQFALFLASESQASIPLSSSGILCLGGPFIRFTSQVQHSGPGGWIAIPVDTNALPAGIPIAILPGSTWNFQAWFRDSQGIPNAGLSLPASITFQ